MSDAVNRGVIRAHERGIVTSASLMVRRCAAPEAVAYGARRDGLSLGLHIDLGEWVYRDGEWRCRYRVVPTDDPVQVERELDRQLALFRSLTGDDPTHLDSHQHVHRSEPLRALALARARALGIPLRDCDSRVRHCGDYYGQSAECAPFPEGITVERLLEIFARLESGVTELGCHPGYAGGESDAYAKERPAELASLCDPHLPVALAREGVKLCSFRDLRSVPATAGTGVTPPTPHAR